MKLDRRFDDRLPIETYLTAYLEDRPHHGFTVDISERGLCLNTLAQAAHSPHTPLGLELKLPGLPEVIWAAGETRRDALDDCFYGLGIRFTAMAWHHEQMLRDYCQRLRRGRHSVLHEFCQRLRREQIREYHQG